MIFDRFRYTNCSQLTSQNLIIWPLKPPPIIRTILPFIFKRAVFSESVGYLKQVPNSAQVEPVEQAPAGYTDFIRQQFSPTTCQDSNKLKSNDDQSSTFS